MKKLNFHQCQVLGSSRNIPQLREIADKVLIENNNKKVYGAKGSTSSTTTQAATKYLGKAHNLCPNHVVSVNPNWRSGEGNPQFVICELASAPSLEVTGIAIGGAW